MTLHLQVRVTDGVHENSTDVNVTIIDVNDNFPQFTQPLYNFSVYEVSFSLNLESNTVLPNCMKHKNNL